MTTPAGDGLVGDAEIRVDADTDPALRALSDFSRNAQRRLTTVERSLSEATSELRTLRSTATSVRIDIQTSGQDEIAAAAAAIRDLLRDANATGPELRAIATRSTTTATALELLESAAQDAARTLRTLRGRIAAVTTALTELRPAATQAASALRRLAQRAEDSVSHLNDLDTAALSASVRIDGLGDALRSSTDDVRDLNGNLRDLTRGLDDVGDATSRTADENEELRGSLGAIASVAARVAKALGPVAGALGAAGAAAGTVAPLLAGVVTALESIAPAAAVGASGTLTLLVAANAIKLGMLGVGEAIETAFDPEADPEELAEAMDRLGPHAKAFVTELVGMRKAFTALQIDVQNRLFAGLDESLSDTAKATLPSLHGALDRTADSLNDMARGAAAAAADLGAQGILGSALASSTRSLSLLERVPGQAVDAFGRLAAAAGPSLERIAAAAAGVADRASESLGRAFASGALEDSISAAVDNIAQLGRIADNVFGGLGNIIKGVSVDGQGLFGTLEKVSQAFEDLTANREFQSTLRQLSQTMSTLVRAVLPLVQEAFKALLPVIEILAPPLRELIRHLGEQLRPVIEKLGPVLAAVAEAFAALIPVLTPVIDLGLRLISAVLPVLTPLFEFLGEVAERLAPIIAQLADNIASQLEPILAVLPGILTQLLAPFLKLADQVLPLLLDSMRQIGPALGQAAQAFADLLVELTPLIVKFLEFQILLLDKLLPVLVPLAGLITGVLVGALRLFTGILRESVIPAVRTVVAFLNVDWRESLRRAGVTANALRDVATRAFQTMQLRLISIVGGLTTGISRRLSGMVADAIRLFNNLVAGAVRVIASLPGRAASALAPLAGRFQARAAEAGQQMVSALRGRINEAVALIRGLPGRASAALGGLGSRLYDSGRALIGGFISGIRSRAAEVAAAASSVVSRARDFFPFSPAKEGPFAGRGWVLYSGQAIGESLAEGLAQREALVRRAAQMVAQTARQAVTGPAVAIPMTAGPLGVGTALGIGTTRTTNSPALTAVNVTLNLTNQGVIGSKREVENWLAGALDSLRLQGRLPMGTAA